MAYDARYRDGSKGFVQHLISFQKVVFEPAAAPLSWWGHFDRTAHRVVDAPGVDFAFRLALDSNRLERMLFLHASDERSMDVEALAASFLGVNAVVEDSVAEPDDRDEHDRIAGALPRLRAKVRQDALPYADSDITLINDFRLFRCVDELIDLALMHGWTFAYQLNAHRLRPVRDDVRWSRKNLFRIEEERRIPSPVKEVERRVAERMERAAFVVEEYVACSEAAACRRIGEIVEERFARSYDGTGFPGSLLEPEQGGEFDDALQTGFHSAWSAELTPWTKAAGAASVDEVQRVLRWRPPEATAQLYCNGVRTDENTMEQRVARIERKLGHASAEHCREFRNAMSIRRADPPFSLVKARSILERIIAEIYRDRIASKHTKNKPVQLFEMITELLGDRLLFPRKIASYLHTIRTLGNLGVHQEPSGAAPESTLDDTDVELNLLMVLQLIEWYLLEYPLRTGDSAAGMKS